MELQDSGREKLNETNNYDECLFYNQIRWTIFFIILLITILVLSLISIILLYRQRNRQPLLKKSPFLIMMSIAGNWLCLLNLCICRWILTYYKK